MNELFSRYQYEFTICLAISFLFPKSLSSSEIHYKFTIYFVIPLGMIILFVNSLSVSQIFYEFTIFFEFTFFFAISLWVHYLLSEITMNAQFFSQNQFEFTICFANGRRFHHLCYEFPMNSLSSLNSLSFLRIHLESTILFSELPWIYYPFHFVTVKTLSILRFHYE